MRILGRWVKSILPAAIIVLFVWSTALADHASITFSQTNSNSGGTAIQGLATGGNDGTHAGVGVVGKSTAGSGIGVWGRATNTSGNNQGVLGETASATGIGVSGRATAISGTTRGVYGEVISLDGIGVHGRHTGDSGIGVLGESDANGTGIVGRATSGTYGIGVLGDATYIGVSGHSTSSSGLTYGIHGSAQSTSGLGVYGEAQALTGVAIGVRGRSVSSSGIGVYGWAAGSSGTTYGVYGTANSASGTGVYGQGSSTGVEGYSWATTGSTRGVFGRALSSSGRGVYGWASSTSGVTWGVYAEAASTSGTGVVGFATASSGFTKGVWGRAQSANGVAVQGNGTNGAKAGLFNGRVDINCPASDCLYVNGGVVADLAEDVPVAGRVNPGDVVVLVQQRGYAVARASRPYDGLVAGIISSQPRMRFGVTGRGPTAPIALTGIVRASATAANGAIRFGDLLTTSSVPGHLMRCSSPARCIGAIVGKALQPLAKGNGQILVLLWRQ